MTKPEPAQPIEPKLLKLMSDIGRIIRHAIEQETSQSGDKYGFALFMFGLGTDKGRMNYISNAQRDDMLAALKEFIAHVEGRYQEQKTSKDQ